MRWASILFSVIISNSQFQKQIPVNISIYQDTVLQKHRKLGTT